MSSKLNRRSFLVDSAAGLAAATALSHLSNSASAADDASLAAFDNQADPSMPNLQQQWYNAVVAGMSLDPTIFQLFQTGAPLLTKDSNDLWQICNAVPPLSVTHQFNPSQYNHFFDDYNGVINSLTIQGLDDFKSMLGNDNYSAWQKYLLKNKKKIEKATNKAQAQVMLYQDWSMVYLDPGLAAKSLAVLENTLRNPFNTALQAILYNGPTPGNQPQFGMTIQDVITKMSSGATLNVQLDTQKTSSDVSHTWAKVELGGAYDFFTGSASTNYSQLSQKASSSRVTVDATFTGVTPVPIAPGTWYTSSAFATAFRSPNDPDVWDPKKPINWDKTFSPSGTIPRLATTLRIASGYTATITSFAKFTQDDQTTIMADASVGFWPFFSATGSGGSDVRKSFGSQGELIVNISVPAKNNVPFIIGVDVTPIGTVLGG